MRWLLVSSGKRAGAKRNGMSLPSRSEASVVALKESPLAADGCSGQKSVDGFLVNNKTPPSRFFHNCTFQRTLSLVF